MVGGFGLIIYNIKNRAKYRPILEKSSAEGWRVGGWPLLDKIQLNQLPDFTL